MIPLKEDFKAVVGKTVFSDGKGKLFFGYYKEDDSVHFVDVYGGFIKSLCFGVFTIGICTYEGYHCHLNSSYKGIRGVTQAATKAVVKSSVFVLVFDYLITSFLL